ncbi:MAG: transposase family protein, partial [Rhodococcus sp.]|nr:transposase family protein [Rhodococcus sp. (in: high G+C Gram-positive bacteria)]
MTDTDTGEPRTPQAMSLKYQPTPGNFPDADHPLHRVQIDHTQFDILIVDDEHRKPIGRPWVTVAIDVYSRVIMGCHLSLDAPSATSVGICVAQAIVPKDGLLLEHGIDAEWPVWGFPRTIHADNAAGEFTSDTFTKACKFYKIDQVLRSKGRPEYGRHIERMIGTFMTTVHGVHGLPGTTYSSPMEKGDVDPEKRAALTFSEFESWLIRYVCTVYNLKIHPAIGIPPLTRWTDGLLKGDSDKPARGVPPRPEHSDDILCNFLPRF